MARSYDIKLKEEKPLIFAQDRWIRGLNKLVSASQVRDDELTSAINIQLVEDGKIQCPRDGQAYYGNESGSRVNGLFTFYKSDGTKNLLRISGTNLQVYNTSTSDWDNVSGASYTTSLNAEGVMAYDKLYLVNGTDKLTYYDGTSITTFTEISAPTISSVTRTGTTGTYTYSYKVTAVTAVGETTASAADSEVANVDTLDSSTYMTVSWGAVTSAIGYNVYGRKDGQWYFMAYVEGNSSTSYVDKGQDTPNEVFTPPEANSTGGVIGTDIALYKDSLFVLEGSRLYYSGGGDQLENFTIGGGGGFIDISKNDGEDGVGIIVFKNKLLIFKENSIYQFSFSTTGLPQVEQVTSAVGAVSRRSIVAVENDVFFANRRGIFTVGNEAGFAFDVLRTNELSARVRSVYQSIDPAYIQNVSAIYATTSDANFVIFSYTPSGSTTNSKAIVYDRERLAWYEWTNIHANCWTEWEDSTGAHHFLYGDDSSGYVKEVLTGSDDFGSSISGSFKIKATDFKDITRYKKLKDVSVVLREPSGSVNMSIIVDGTTTAFQSNVSTISPAINFAHYTYQDFTFADSFGSGAVTTTDDVVLRTKRNLNTQGRTFQLTMDNGSSGASFTLLATQLIARPRSLRFRQSTDLIS